MIRVKDIHKSFGKKQVLRGVTFEIEEGELVSLIGKIGSGKTTIINILSGLIKPDKGTIEYNGQEVSSFNRNYTKDFGFLLSEDYLIEEFSTVLYWKCIGKMLKLRSEVINTRIQNLIELCNIMEQDKPINQLSSGNMMLVKLGAMLLGDPKILIIDEPFLHLDIVEIARIETLLADCNKSGKTIILTTHHPEPIFRIGNRVLVLADGVIDNQIFVNNYKSFDTFQNDLYEFFITGKTTLRDT